MNNDWLERPARGLREDQPERKRPVHQLKIGKNRPTIVFLTVCTKDRKPWLLSPPVHELLKLVWLEASAWLVGRYTLMPDHLHLFAAPGELELPLGSWVRYWKSEFSKRHGNPDLGWQTDYWDTTLRAGETYLNKWEYVRNNPVRHGLVNKAEDWPFQGEIHVLPW
jgi:putative transposase